MPKSEYLQRRLAEVEQANLAKLDALEQHERELAEPHPTEPLRRKDGKFTGGIARSSAWKPGQSGNPAGKPRGSKNVLTKKFVEDLSRAWQRYGRDALAQVAQENPAAFLAVCARVVPADALQQPIEPTRVTVRITPHGPDARPALPEPERAEPAPEPAKAELTVLHNDERSDWDTDPSTCRKFRPLPERKAGHIV